MITSTSSVRTLKSILSGIIDGDKVAQVALRDYVTEFGEILTPELRRAARLDAGTKWTGMPVEFDIDDETDFAGVAGESWHYVNKSGDRICHPSAYRAAYGKPIYVPSTLVVVVGPRWILKQLEQING